MKSLTVLAALVGIICVVQSEEQRDRRDAWSDLGKLFGIREKNPCERDPLPILTEAINAFSISLTKRAGFYANSGNFVISPYTIWLSLAAIAEYTEEVYQAQLFAILNLPQERCLREKLYELAMNIEISDRDVNFKRRRALVISDNVRINEQWYSFADRYKALEYLPIRFDEENFSSMLTAMDIRKSQVFYGNSVILDRMYYQGAWTSAFSDGFIEQGPFYNELGQVVGQTEYMRMKKRVRLAHIPFIDAKVLELPVGSDGRYTMLLAMGVKNNTIRAILELLRNSLILDIISALTLSLIPIEVAVPRFYYSHGYNAKPLLEDMGFGKLFDEPAATRYISDPPAFPSYYFQRLDINITNSYVRYETPSNVNNPLTSFFDGVSDVATGLAKAVGRDFIANRPFLYTLVDTKTKVPIFTGVYSFPEEHASVY